MTTTQNLAEMDREQLKSFVREREWDGEIDLRKSTEEIRELAMLKAELDEDEPAEATEPVLLPEEDAPSVEVSTELADEQEAPQDGAQAPEPPSETDLAGPSPAPLPEDPSAIQYYRVDRFARWVKDGMVYQLAAGTFVSTMSHPIDELFAQGVPLVEVDSVDDSDPGIGHRFA